jgi:NTE family protein
LYLISSISFNQWDYFETSTYFFEDKKPSYLIENENFFDFHIGMPTGKSGIVDAGISMVRTKDEYYQTNTFSRSDTADVTYFDYGATNFAYEYSTLNRKQYPTLGTNIKTSFYYIDGSEKTEPGSTSVNKEITEKGHQYFYFDIKFTHLFRLVKKLNMGVHADITLSTQDLFANYVSSVLNAPAFHPIPESKTLFIPEFRSYWYGAGGLSLIYSIFRNVNIRLEGYYFQPYRAIEEQPDRTAELGPVFNTHYYMASSALVYHSPIGPVSLSLNYYDQDTDQFSFLFNFGYIIFNKRVIE